MMTTATRAGFYWHVHEGTLMGWCYDYEGRIHHILRSGRPEEEQNFHLRLLQPVRGRLPVNVKQEEAPLRQAWDTYKQTMAALTKDSVDDLIHAEQNYVWAEKSCRQAVAAHPAEIETLHEEECPDCPWNGVTIFATTGKR